VTKACGASKPIEQTIGKMKSKSESVLKTDGERRLGMAGIAQVKDGQIVETASQASMSKAQSSSNNGMDKDAFLQLLVAQMKYQDPLEPTSNTEYISQYAQFSQVEQMQNMAGSMTLQRASGLVGENVIIESTTSSGNTTSIQGLVDYVTYENNKAFVSVNGSLYSMDDVKNVVDKTYQAAYDKAVAYVGKTNKLPSLDSLKLDNAETVEQVLKEYEDMSDYEKGFVASDVVSKLSLYTEKLKEMRASREDAEEENGEITEA